MCYQAARSTQYAAPQEISMAITRGACQPAHLGPRLDPVVARAIVVALLPALAPPASLARLHLRQLLVEEGVEDVEGAQVLRKLLLDDPVAAKAGSQGSQHTWHAWAGPHQCLATASLLQLEAGYM
jgi:hypothetical protein